MTEVYVATSDNKSAYHEDEDCQWLERANDYMAVDKSEVEDDLKACRSCAFQLPVDQLGTTMSGKSSGFIRAQREAYLILALIEEGGLGLAEIKDKYGVLYQSNDGWPTIMREMSINTLENYMSELVQKGFAEYTNDGLYKATEKGVSVVNEPIEHYEDEVKLARWALEDPNTNPKKRLTDTILGMRIEDIQKSVKPDGLKYSYTVDELLRKLDIPHEYKEYKIKSAFSDILQKHVERGHLGKLNHSYIHPELKLIFENGELAVATINSRDGWLQKLSLD